MDNQIRDFKEYVQPGKLYSGRWVLDSTLGHDTAFV